MNKPNISIKCPTCGKKDTWNQDNAFKPFCSERCKLIDLGEWASEGRKIAGDEISQDAIEDDGSGEQDT